VNIWLEDFKQQLTIAGFRDVKIKDVDKFLQMVKGKTDISVQFFDALLIAGWEHLCFAALNALNAFKNKVSISNSITMETLLYASAQRQIKEAVGLMGIKSSSNCIAVLILTETPKQASTTLQIVAQLVGGRRDDSVLDFTDEKIILLKRLFKISNVELEAKLEGKGAEKKALTDLVFEHMALLVTQR
jgi:tRNA threonylcarbamoyladenosine modification (KEOPS) complex Cgi121 subunit